MQLTQTSGKTHRRMNRLSPSQGLVDLNTSLSDDLVASDHTAMVKAALCQMIFLRNLNDSTTLFFIIGPSS